MTIQKFRYYGKRLPPHFAYKGLTIIVIIIQIIYCCDKILRDTKIFVMEQIIAMVTITTMKDYCNG